MSKAGNVLRYYVLCNHLKDVIRKGCIIWNVKRERIESVAEHIYGVQMLAIAMKSEYNYDIDLTKTLMMIAVHELEEIKIGDYGLNEITKEEKNKIGNKAAYEVLSSLLSRDEIMSIVLEFNERKTKEAKFSHLCDKLECDLQAKLYDEENCVDLNNQPNNFLMNNNYILKLLEEENSFGDMWLRFGIENYEYDDNFKEVSNYAKNNKILEFKKEL